jgi:proteasome lid subunit RPN8/RPN11
MQNFPQNGSKKNRFSIAPKILFQAQKYARDQEFAIIGIYHSHPDHLAIPSEFDRSIAWANYSYLIVSLDHEQIKEVKCWSLDETEQFQQEKMLILPV